MLLSVIIPVFNEEEIVAETYRVATRPPSARVSTTQSAMR